MPRASTTSAGGAFTVAAPQWLFRLAGMPDNTHPQIFACLGMVIGLYGLVYLETARRPESGWPYIAVGLLGKVLGPLGLAYLILSGAWPVATVVLCLTNDLVWWAPSDVPPAILAVLSCDLGVREPPTSPPQA